MRQKLRGFEGFDAITSTTQDNLWNRSSMALMQVGEVTEQKKLA
jgi:hypothetical protein